MQCRCSQCGVRGHHWVASKRKEIAMGGGDEGRWNRSPTGWSSSLSSSTRLLYATLCLRSKSRLCLAFCDWNLTHEHYLPTPQSTLTMSNASYSSHILCDGMLLFVRMAEKIEQKLYWKTEISDIFERRNLYKLLYSFQASHNCRKASCYIYQYSIILRNEVHMTWESSLQPFKRG